MLVRFQCCSDHLPTALPVPVPGFGFGAAFCRCCWARNGASSRPAGCCRRVSRAACSGGRREMRAMFWLMFVSMAGVGMSDVRPIFCFFDIHDMIMYLYLYHVVSCFLVQNSRIVTVQGFHTQEVGRRCFSRFIRFHDSMSQLKPQGLCTRPSLKQGTVFRFGTEVMQSCPSWGRVSCLQRTFDNQFSVSNDDSQSPKLSELRSLQGTSKSEASGGEFSFRLQNLSVFDHLFWTNRCSHMGCGIGRVPHPDPSEQRKTLTKTKTIKTPWVVGPHPNEQRPSKTSFFVS